MLAPLYSNIIVRLDEAKDKSEAGIILPRRTRRSTRASGGRSRPLAPGQRDADAASCWSERPIIFRDHAGQEIESAARVVGDEHWRRAGRLEVCVRAIIGGVAHDDFVHFGPAIRLP